MVPMGGPPSPVPQKPTFDVPIAQTPRTSTHPWRNAADAGAGGSLGALIREQRPRRPVPFQLLGGDRPSATEAQSQGLLRSSSPAPLPR